MTEQDMELTRLAAKAAGIEQEPVAYSYTSRISGRQTFSLHPKPPHLDSDSWDIQPLYTEPTKREWVRLDANDYEEIRSVVPNTINDFVFCDMIAIISAKLKERNA